MGCLSCLLCPLLIFRDFILPKGSQIGEAAHRDPAQAYQALCKAYAETQTSSQHDVAPFHTKAVARILPMVLMDTPET